MKRENYLDELKAQLGGFSAETRSDILAEIENHIDDLALSEKGDAIEQEMGPADLLVDGLKREIRPNRFQDFLLALLPTIILGLGLQMILARYMGPAAYPLTGFVSEAVIAAGLAAFLHQRSFELRLYWSGYAVIQASVLLMFMASGYIELPVVLMGATVLLIVSAIALLVANIGRILQRANYDPLLTTFIALPLVMQGTLMIGNTLTTQSIGLTQYAGRITAVHLSNYAVTIAVLALIFLPTNRSMRWAGLFLNSAFPLLTFSILLWPHVNQPIIYATLLSQQAIPFLGWQRDRIRRNPFRLAR